jgi:hypothetical protein
MGKNDLLLKELSDKLENTVSAVHYAHLIKCLKRCQELMSEAAAKLTDVELQTDMRIYAAALDGFFDDVSRYPTAYFETTKGYDPVAYLKKQGVIKEPPPSPPFPYDLWEKFTQPLKKPRAAKAPAKKRAAKPKAKAKKAQRQR